MMFLRIGNSLDKGSTWFTDPDIGASYAKEFMNCSNNQTYYNAMGADYEEVFRSWGYCAPELAAKAIFDHRDLFEVKPEEVKFVDLGCGTGLCGQALKKEGFERFIGVDFAQVLLDEAKKKNVYKKLKHLDLLDRLPFQDNLFDCAVGTGVTCHLSEVSCA